MTVPQLKRIPGRPTQVRCPPKPRVGASSASSTAPEGYTTFPDPDLVVDSRAPSPEVSGRNTGVIHKSREIADLFLREPYYRRNATAMAGAEAAAALSNCCYLMALQVTGGGGYAAAASMVVDTVRFGAAVIAYHQRDNEDLFPVSESPQSKVAQLSQSLALHGIGDTALTVAFLGAVAGTGLRPENSDVTRAVALSVALGKTYLATRYFGLWSCLKVYLGDAHARTMQRDYNRTIGAFEYVLFAMMSRTGGSALYLRMRDLMHGDPTDLVLPVVCTLVASSALNAAFNANFVLQSGQREAVPAVLPAHAPAELRPLMGKLNALGHLLAHDPDYRKHALAMLVRRFGLGLSTAGYLHLMNKEGSPALVAGISLGEDFVRYISFFMAHHERDNEDLVLQHHGTADRRAALTGDLAKCGVPDAVNTALVIAGLAMTVDKNRHPWAVLSILCATKVLDTYVRNREAGFWNCLKIHLGDETSRERQSAINRTIVGVEGTALNFLNTAVSIGVYGLLNVVGGQNSPAAAYTCIGVAGLGLMMAAAGSVFFAHEARHWEAERVSDADSDASETTPLLASA